LQYFSDSGVRDVNNYRLSFTELLGIIGKYS
jgi:hypothetical protein